MTYFIIEITVALVIMALSALVVLH